MKKIGSFFKEKPLGKAIVSVGIGALNMTPMAPFVPSIKEASGGLAGKGKQDVLAWISAIATLGAIILFLTGDKESGMLMLEHAK